MFDAEGRILLFNQRYVELMDRTGMPLQGRLLIDVLREVKAAGEWDGDPEEFFAAMMADAKAGKTVTKTVDRSGRSLRVVDQPMRGGGWVATHEDITEWQAAGTDRAHGAPRRADQSAEPHAVPRTAREALRLGRRSDQFAVLCLDLDHFKEINDTLGHPVGDALLKAVARRLRECVRENDMVARLGGDEFAIVQFCQRLRAVRRRHARRARGRDRSPRPTRSPATSSSSAPASASRSRPRTARTRTNC